MASPPPAVAAPTRVRRGRVVALGGALVLTVMIAATSIMLPEREAAASTRAQPGSVVTAAVLPSVTAATTPTSAATAAATTAARKMVVAPEADPPPPARSGSGRRIVFDQSDQRVWLVEADGTVDRTYLVSGSRHDNLQPGTYAVQSRQRKAVSFDYTGTMEYFVRFTTGRNAPIGFHSIPVYNNGEPEQTVEQLGTALSAGCVRQRKSDAKYLWDWAPDGTPVVVTA
ncbi:L,D-transpeptidase [Aeromicrobium sp.]|uniref:L,D-transpeptidase n=1 Tax=Aeromicrobium sp. TaxID=1871063 RepID=UPI0028A8F776|nr:L,D-transpeptidase [Aeromicrobium sp.]